MDFFETLQLLQFSKYSNIKSRISYTFINPNFGKDKNITDDFYKQAIDITSLNELKGTKRMSPTHYINLCNRLIRMHDRQKMSKLESARLKLKFALNNHVQKHEQFQEIIPKIEVPDYSKKEEIAGYYGKVELSELKSCFRSYFPIYRYETTEEVAEQQIAETNMDVECFITCSEAPAQNVENTKIIDQETAITTSPIDQEDRVKVLETIVEESVENVENLQPTSLIDFNNDPEANKENQPPAKKRRKYISRAAKVTIKETTNALMNLQMEMKSISSTF